MSVSKRLSMAVVVAVTLSLLAASGIQPAQAHEDHEAEPREFTDREQHRPTPLPDRVVLSWSGDPTTTINVTWRTDASAEDTRAEFIQADRLVGNLRDGVKDCEQIGGSRTEFTSDLGACLIHSAKLEGLEPGVMYAYRVGDGEHWSEWFQFRTACDDDREPFTFVYFGDAQNELRSLWSRVIREANQYAPRAAFMLHAGDLINSDNSDAEWGEWFGAGGWLNGMIPVVATPGNHEYDDERGLTAHWQPQFDFPLNGPSGLEETAYWFDYQGARIISLNSNERIAEQRAWLADVLDDEQRPKWTIVTFHHPIFSAAKDRDNSELREAWRQTLEEGGVDLVLQGHDHSYARSGLGGPKNVTEGLRVKNSNTVYVVSVSGPKQYPLQESWDVSREASGVQLFQVIQVSPEQISYEARLATGELYDAFALRKEGKTSTLTEDIPATPEIRARIPEDD